MTERCVTFKQKGNKMFLNLIIRFIYSRPMRGKGELWVTFSPVLQLARSSQILFDYAHKRSNMVEDGF